MIQYSSLEGKLILLTGVTSGIGRGICDALLAQKAKIVGIGRNRANVQDLIDNLNIDSFTFLELDLTETDKIELALKNCISEHGKFDGFVHCAGKEETIPLSIYKADKIQSIFELNVFAGIEILRCFTKKKYSNENSSAILFSSVMGELGQAGKVGYCGTKAAVLGVVKASALELAKRKIRINAISPGVVQTPMTKKLFSQLSEDNISEIEKMHPLGFGEVEDISPLVMFLLSNQSKWITGQNIKADGGYSIQ